MYLVFRWNNVADDKAKIIMSNKLGGIVLNGNKLNWIIGTHGHWKNQNPANSAHFLGEQAELSLFPLRPMPPNLLDIINYS